MSDRAADNGTVWTYAKRLVPIYKRLIELAAELAIAEEGIANELGWPPIKTYVMSGGDSRLVKIGRSVDVEGRMRTLQAGSPVKLKVLRVIPFDCERAMHQRYAHLRRHGEWFELDLDMLTDSFNEELMAEAHAALAEAP